MHEFKCAILPESKNCQNGTFEPVHGIQFFSANRLLLKCYEDDIYKKNPNMSQGPPNPGFRSVRVEN